MEITTQKERVVWLGYLVPLHFPMTNFEILSKLSVHDRGWTQHLLSLWKATFYLLVFALILHLGDLLMKQDFALLDTVPTLEKKGLYFPKSSWS